MAEDADVEGLEDIPAQWFSRDGADVLYFKVNRRPLGGEPNLFQPDPDLLAHIEQVLALHESASSGRNPQREWRIGNLNFNREEGWFTGQLGWSRVEEALRPSWDEAEGAWSDKVVSQDDGAVAPIAFTLAGETLGVMKHPTFTTEGIIPTVLTQIFNAGELSMEFPTTEWSVEPLGDERSFQAWLNSVDQLLVLKMTFKRPNPDGEEDFQSIFERLDSLEAKLLREEIRASDEDRGLNKTAVRKDPTTWGFISAAMRAYGYLVGIGRRNGHPTKYDQREQVLRQHLSDVGGNMDTASKAVLEAVENMGSKRKRVDRGPGKT